MHRHHMGWKMSKSVLVMNTPIDCMHCDILEVCDLSFYKDYKRPKDCPLKPAEDFIPISFIEKITHRDICLVYRGCLLMLLEKWREENE